MFSIIPISRAPRRLRPVAAATAGARPTTSRTKGILIFTVCLGFFASLKAQDIPAARAASEVTPPMAAVKESAAEPHRFWDQENAWLFAAVAGARMLDYTSTRHFRDQGNKELLLSDRVVDNKPLFVGVELAGTAVSMGVSYLCHRTGHHTAERWVSIVHIGAGVGGSIHNYTLTPPAAQVSPAVANQPAH